MEPSEPSLKKPGQPENSESIIIKFEKPKSKNNNLTYEDWEQTEIEALFKL
jgi:hypothetical protein